MRVLVVEDEPYLRSALGAALRQQGWSVDVSGDGAEALGLAHVHSYDVVVLDRDLPSLHGDDVCTAIARSDLPCRVLMLTAAGRLRDRIDGFECGADDYLSKPFALDELIVRIRAIARRAGEPVTQTLRAGDIELDLARRTVTRGGAELKLTMKQYGVLAVLLRARGAVVSAEELLEKVWDINADPFTSAPRVTVSTLRRVLGAPDPITTVVGAGYRIDP